MVLLVARLLVRCPKYNQEVEVGEECLRKNLHILNMLHLEAQLRRLLTANSREDKNG